jgi:hypothetical protein
MYDNNGSRARQRWDNNVVVSLLVMQAYAVSLLLLASVLIWTVGDAWMQYFSYSPESAYSHDNNFTVLDFAPTL